MQMEVGYFDERIFLRYNKYNIGNRKLLWELLQRYSIHVCVCERITFFIHVPVKCAYRVCFQLFRTKRRFIVHFISQNKR